MKRNLGFSALELVMALVVLAVLVAVALPTLGPMQRNYRVMTAASQVAGEIQTARLLAISRNASLQFSVDSATGSYRVIDPADTGNPPRTAKTLPDGVTFQTVPSQPLTFFARGNSQAGIIRVGAETFSVQITVSTSGRVKVER
ncbi:MAG: GspH/FimT family protein [Acidobacteria bacterium]|nr:GspH/FimT family protein [Acidobacteriota bacterium]